MYAFIEIVKEMFFVRKKLLAVAKRKKVNKRGYNPPRAVSARPDRPTPAPPTIVTKRKDK